MKILQIIQAKQYRGAEIFCCQFSNHLLDLGHDVLILSIYGGSAILPFNKKVVSLNRPRHNRYFDVLGWKEIARIISNFKPDVVQANAADTLKYAILSKITFGWNVPVIYRNASASSFYIKSRFSKSFNSFLLRKVQLIISVSESSKKDLNSLFPFTTCKTVVIPVGIEKQKIKSLSMVLDPDKINIVHAGSFTREKNHQELIDIFKILLMKSDGFILHLLGDGDLREDLENRITKENLEEKVVFHGGVKDPLSYIKAADVLVLPSIIEGLPGVLLEAMYCKTPVVAYDVGGVGEIVFSETGYLIEKGNIISFAEAIMELSDKHNSSLKIQKAYEQVVQKYLNTKLAKKFLRYYQDIIDGRGQENKKI